MRPRFKRLIHRKTTKAEGWSIIWSASATLVGFIAFVWLFYIWAPLDWGLITFIAVIGGLIFSLLFYVAALLIQSNEAFFCYIDDRKLICRTPTLGSAKAWQSGESFSLSVKDIAKIEEVPDNEFVNRSMWYVWNRSGQRYVLTTNYDNPAEDFVEAIRERIPGIEVTRTN